MRAGLRRAGQPRTSRPPAARAHHARRGLRGLPSRQREVLVLRYFLGMQEAEVAQRARHRDRLGQQHSSRGLAALAQVLEVTMNVEEDLGRRLAAALTAEVETMGIDRRAARNRLEQELSARDRQRSARRWLAAAVILAVAALVAWSATGPNRAMPAARDPRRARRPRRPLRMTPGRSCWTCEPWRCHRCPATWCPSTP